MKRAFAVEHLSIAFQDKNEPLQTVVSDVSFSIGLGKGKSEIVGVVGESGSGKSMTALAAMGLLKDNARVLQGAIWLEEQNLFSLNAKELSRVQGSEMSMIFQEPMTSLNPLMRIGEQVGESLFLHPGHGAKLSKKEIRRQVLKALEEVGLENAERVYRQFPHELSGGQRQRVMIAQAMINQPKLLIADEPTTALDVMVQEQILELLRRLHREKGVSILFISHDLAVIEKICSRVLVMYQGQIVEEGAVSQVLHHPKHEYTRTLVERFPRFIAPPRSKQNVLTLRDVSVFYRERKAERSGAQRREIVHHANLEIREGEILGLVGESGSGKSTLAKAIVGLNPQYEGEILMQPDLQPQMVFQDPFGSLNPAHTIGWILSEPLRIIGIKSAKERKERVLQMLENMGLSKDFYNRYARELSGGQRQRVSIGAALLRDSKLLVADEPVSALDVTVQSQILQLLLEVHRQNGLSILFISHDLNLVRHICHRVAVMYQGEIVEIGDAQEIYRSPKHPYTRRLLQVENMNL